MECIRTPGKLEEGKLLLLTTLNCWKKKTPRWRVLAKLSISTVCTICVCVYKRKLMLTCLILYILWACKREKLFFFFLHKIINLFSKLFPPLIFISIIFMGKTKWRHKTWKKKPSVSSQCRPIFIVGKCWVSFNIFFSEGRGNFPAKLPWKVPYIKDQGAHHSLLVKNPILNSFLDSFFF